MAKKVIAIDIDDVLSSSEAGFTGYSNERWGTKLTVDDYTENWHEMWGIDIHETRKRSNEIHSSGRLGSFEHFEDAVPVLHSLKSRYKLVVLTSRRRLVHDVTMDWLDRHFRGIFDDVHYSGFYDELKLGSLDQTKGELSKQIGADYLIDDQIKHVFAAANAGIKGVLFGRYKWNRAEKLPPRVVRCETWAEVGEYFDHESR